jgi:signal transduction histidine kinase
MLSEATTRFAALNQFTLAAAGTTSETEILSMAVETIGTMFPLHGGIGLVHAEGGLAVVASWSPDGEMSIDETCDEQQAAALFTGDVDSDIEINDDGSESLIAFRFLGLGRLPDLLILRVQMPIGRDSSERELLALCRQHLGVALATARAHSDLERRVDLRTTELAGVNAELSRRLAELRTAQSALVEASRKAGMADVATSVLHNVGNVLNSVNVSVKVLTDRLRGSRVHGIEKAMALLAAQPDRARFLADDPRGRRLVEYLAALGGTLTGERDAALAELEELGRSVDHIRSIVDAQQATAGSARIVEPVELADLLGDAVRVTAPISGRQAPAIEIVSSGPPRGHLDRHKVLQILVNLVSNARHAVRGQPAARIVLRSTAIDPDQIAIAVEDNGVGIREENLTRVFQHGFTTRANGHGFGLHACACAAVELGGQLTVHSDGAGRGARFTLTLPRELAP